ncbi:MAG: N-acetyl-gamma-glutamyl-phosphate reductase [bacterium]
MTTSTAPSAARVSKSDARAAVPLFLFGARGLLAGELLRLLELHEGFVPQALVGRSGRDVAAAHPHVDGAAAPLAALVKDAVAAEDALAAALEDGGEAAVVLALPHGESAAAWSRMRERLGALAERAFVVDLSADYRLQDATLHREAYGEEPPDAGERARFVYGLPELLRAEIAGARRVAAPGCFATALQLAVVPAARAGLLDDGSPWFLSAVTGSSGSGVDPKPGTHHPHRHGNLWAYSLDGHRHEAELRQSLEGTGLSPDLHFVPHSGPFARGIHLTACLPLARDVSAEEAAATYLDAYAGEPFVRVLEDGAPDLRSVTGSNAAALRVYIRGDALHVLLTLDNLVKGGAGQALQCLNLMLGFSETRGLPRFGLGVS